MIVCFGSAIALRMRSPITPTLTPRVETLHRNVSPNTSPPTIMFPITHPRKPHGKCVGAIARFRMRRLVH
ncbi:MAG: hypothetical protein F6K19_14995 [Cyanothece sp. SIO1E1]|nr:hypothetical protein [Cyanothece sp. SIO1E1]